MTKYMVWRGASTVLFLVLQVAIMFGLIGMGSLDFTRSVAVTTCLWMIYTFIEIKYNFFMNNYVRIAVMTAISSDSFFGYYLAYYVTSFVYDKIQHIFGTYAFALFAYVLLVNLLKYPMSKVVKFVFVASLGLSIGALYEIAEFLVDTFSNPIIPGQPSLLDTDLDMICDTIGALLAAFHASSKTFVNEEF